MLVFARNQSPTPREKQEPELASRGLPPQALVRCVVAMRARVLTGVCVCAGAGGPDIGPSGRHAAHQPVLLSRRTLGLLAVLMGVIRVRFMDDAKYGQLEPVVRKMRARMPADHGFNGAACCLQEADLSALDQMQKTLQDRLQNSQFGGDSLSRLPGERYGQRRVLALAFGLVDNVAFVCCRARRWCWRRRRACWAEVS